MSSLWIVLAFAVVALITRILVQRGGLSGSRSIGGGVVFRGFGPVRVLCVLVIPGAIYGAFQVSWREDPLIAAIFLVLSGSLAFFWQNTIVVDETGLKQHIFLELGERHARWSDVEYASIRPDLGSVLVCLKGGAKIKHTPFHVGRTEFLELLRTHCTVY